MKFCITLSLFFISVIGQAQDSAVHLSPKMFDTNQAIVLNYLDEWRFHQGHDSTWARPYINTIGWEKLKPTQVSKKMADKNGRIEGWFRLKIYLDSSFDGIPLYLSTDNRGATDTYIDGNLFESYGNTGIDGKAFNAPDRNDKSEMKPVQLTPGKEYILAIHLVNYVPAFPLNLITRDDFSGIYPLLSGPALLRNMNEYYDVSRLYQTVSITICAVLSLLFWLLAFQNPRETNLRLIALCPTCFALAAWLGFIQLNSSLSLGGLAAVQAVALLFYDSIVLLPSVLLAKIFTNKVPRKLLLALSVIFIIMYYSRFSGHGIFVSVMLVILVIISLYYVISSWRTLKGAQWAIVAGVLVTLFWVAIWGLSDFTPLSIGNLQSVMAIFLSFPLSLLVYVSLRFREIINEVRENAQQVVQLSEEKKEAALNQQKILQEEVNRQTAELRHTLDNLKSTQSQLIQSEKMASLGELTAGIAHEIQNPLNFVNNFSDVNTELIAEMKEEINKGNIDEVKDIANDIEENEQKINRHGKRADTIVKGMLQHSKASTGKKELTDITKFVDEYLRLAYHGMRAKDKEFNADFKTDFDETIGKINIVPQDIGRVLLNLFNNAFYAVNEKSKAGDVSYQPVISVQTKKLNDKVEVRVEDNGNGIPKNIVDKIFQPFFTTKPTGQGTGLGLSLAYDIIKAHGGEIKVETEEDEGTEFIVQLPVK